MNPQNRIKITGDRWSPKHKNSIGASILISAVAPNFSSFTLKRGRVARGRVPNVFDFKLQRMHCCCTPCDRSPCRRPFGGLLKQFGKCRMFPAQVFFLNIHWAKKTFADSFVLQHQQHQLAISVLQHFRPRCRGALQPRIGRNSHRTIWTNIENMPFLNMSIFQHGSQKRQVYFITV